ncbi:ankyrin repeat domain-containing protein [Arthrobacter sp. NPDC056691]|uniref:ankyrin repeat domain-containing protein n=1 Tax=Arthrobacter sp. NPDC056691 TaxID=3345913 RepID=UPI00367178DE
MASSVREDHLWCSAPQYQESRYLWIPPAGPRSITQHSPNDAAEVTRLITDGQSPDSSDSQGFTPLRLASQEHALAAAAALLNHGATVDPTNSFGNTPLFVAVFNSHGRAGMIDLLRSRGADPLHSNPGRADPRGTGQINRQLRCGTVLSRSQLTAVAKNVPIGIPLPALRATKSAVEKPPFTAESLTGSAHPQAPPLGTQRRRQQDTCIGGAASVKSPQRPARVPQVLQLRPRRAPLPGESIAASHMAPAEPLAGHLCDTRSGGLTRWGPGSVLYVSCKCSGRVPAAHLCTNGQHCVPIWLLKGHWREAQMTPEGRLPVPGDPSRTSLRPGGVSLVSFVCSCGTHQ